MKQILAVIVLVIWIATPLMASIDLENFDVMYESDSARVRIEWRSSTETNIAEYRLYQSADDPSLGELIESVPAQGGPEGGADYVVYDEPDTSGFYFYKLVEYSTSGAEVALFKPTDDGDGSNDVYFVKVYRQQLVIDGQQRLVFDASGDGHAVTLTFEPGAQGEVTVRQVNDSTAAAPGTQSLPLRWELASTTSDSAVLEFSLTPEDTANLLHPGMMHFDSLAGIWSWLGGTLQNTVLVLENAVPAGLFVFNKTLPGDATLDGAVDVSDWQRLGDVWLQQAGTFENGGLADEFNFHQAESTQVIDSLDVVQFKKIWQLP